MNTDAMDVVIYFHGFALGADGTPPLSTFVEVSGLWDADDGVTFARRARPTLVVIPRGDGKPFVNDSWPYRFPATIAQPERIIALALGKMAEARRLQSPTSPASIGKARLLLMAHSGGGLAVLQVLAKLKTPPTEIYLFDALYQNADALVCWATAALTRRGTRLWVGYLGGTASCSEELAVNLAELLAGQPARVTERFRVEPLDGCRIDHMVVPRAYAPLLLKGGRGPMPVS
ncbi:MAG: hypothetical protein WCP68_02275 [Enhydrobacter sp.]